jgi:hypothetical protein
VTARGGRVVLLDSELWMDSPYRTVLLRVANELGVPMVDAPAILDDGRRRIERDLEARMNLVPGATQPASSSTSTSVVFRVWRGSVDVPDTLSIVGTDPQLGALVPNAIAMKDDGTGGDQQPGDGVWSYAASLPPGARVFYVYTNSGGRGRWEGLDVPSVRSLDAPAAAGGQLSYAPVETFGRVYMQADHWHPDAAGYDAIAREVANAVLSVR